MWNSIFECEKRECVVDILKEGRKMSFCLTLLFGSLLILRFPIHFLLFFPRILAVSDYFSGICRYIFFLAIKRILRDNLCIKLRYDSRELRKKRTLNIHRKKNTTWLNRIRTINGSTTVRFWIEQFNCVSMLSDIIHAL